MGLPPVRRPELPQYMRASSAGAVIQRMEQQYSDGDRIFDAIRKMGKDGQFKCNEQGNNLYVWFEGSGSYDKEHLHLIKNEDDVVVVFTYDAAAQIQVSVTARDVDKQKAKEKTKALKANGNWGKDHEGGRKDAIQRTIKNPKLDTNPPNDAPSHLVELLEYIIESL
jgi:hypothetical protein